MEDNDPLRRDIRRRRAVMRSLGIASAAAFAGGVAVVGVQYALGVVSAGYPPVVLALHCVHDDGSLGKADLIMEGGSLLPVVEFPSPSAIACRIDAPGADYATWSILGPVIGIRSGPLDATLPCQSPEDFAAQDPSKLRLSTCQRMQAERPGLYLLTVTVMLRGQHAPDRARLAIRVTEPDAPPPAPAMQQSWRLSVTLQLPAAESEQTRQAELSASFGEHGLTAQSRSFERTVYQLAPGETFVSASFQARSASNASNVRFTYNAATRRVTARFTLRSGSLIDRTRGWISGTAVVRVRSEQPPRELDLNVVELSVPGRAELPLPDGIDAARGRLLLRRPETATSVDLAPGGTATLDGARVTSTIGNGVLVLEAVAD